MKLMKKIARIFIAICVCCMVQSTNAVCSATSSEVSSNFSQDEGGWSEYQRSVAAYYNKNGKWQRAMVGGVGAGDVYRRNWCGAPEYKIVYYPLSGGKMEYRISPSDIRGYKWMFYANINYDTVPCYFNM